MKVKTLITSILIPTDFSPASYRATQFGMEIAQLNQDARLSLLHIRPVESRFLSKNNNKSHQDELDKMVDKMDELSRNMTNYEEGKITNVVLSGNVENTMLNFIRDNKFDMVIIGINGNGYDNVLGSHTIKLIEQSHIPVLVVPNSSNGDLIS